MSCYSIQYQAGLGNTFESEAIHGTVPHGPINPRRVRFGLYSKQVTASAFVPPRSHSQNAYLYCVRPAAAHQARRQVLCL